MFILRCPQRHGAAIRAIGPSRNVLALLLSAVAVHGTGPALAQGVPSAPTPGIAQEMDERKITVMTRPKPELDPLGARLGSFLLYPSVGVGMEFDDNIYRTKNDRESDFIAHVAPELRVVSDWNNHELEFRADIEAGRYFDNTSEDYTDWGVETKGRLDVTRATQLFGEARYESLHEDRGSPDDVAGVEPTEFDRATLSVGGSHRMNRVTVTGEGRYVRLDFDDVRAAGVGHVNNDDRDRDVWIAAAQANYEIVPAYQAFVRAVYNVRDYRLGTDDFGIDRDSDGIELVVGSEFDLTGVTFGNVFAGYRSQWYQDDRLDSISGFAFGGQLTSNFTPITTGQLTVQRQIEETSVNTAEGFWSTGVRATLDHELLRNLILRAGLGYYLQEYKGIDRDDDVFIANAGAIWQMNRHLGVGATYTFESRDSHGDAAGTEYDDNRVMLRVTGRL